MKARTACLTLVALLAVSAAAASGGHYVFARQFADSDALRPRGGTTKGPGIDLVTVPTDDFRRLQATEISRFERDRRAILAMAGPYRVSFDFVEVADFSADPQPRAPYQSWATEYVYIVADQRHFISLQHLMVMRIIDDEGAIHGPFVIKHWRQDWRYEATAIHRYRGDQTWERQAAAPANQAQQWAQTVWQVADSPRYASWGEWRHYPEYSTWDGDQTWRPLPRREFSVRDDYDALVGTNRHTILPTGWLHEQRNVKVISDGRGGIERRLALEYGVARYERIQDYDFSAGDAWLQATQPFWESVRAYWDQLLAGNATVELRPQVDDTKLFEPLFARAQAIADGDRPFDRAMDEQFIRDTIDSYLVRP